MDQQLREGALIYFANKKRWNFGRFLHHLDTLPHFPKDKKSRHELGTEIWTAFLWEFARDDSHPEYKLKALKGLSENLQKPTTTATNNALDANINRTIEGNNKIISITPKPEAKEVEAVRFEQGGTSFIGDRDSALPPPPYESCPWKSPPKSALDGPDIVIAVADLCFSSESIHVQHAECEVINETPKYPLEGDEFAGLDFSDLVCGDFPDFLSDETADLLAAFNFGGTYVAPGVSVNNTLFSAPSVVSSPSSESLRQLFGSPTPSTVKDPAEPGVAENFNLDIEAPSVVSSPSSESLRQLFGNSPTPSTTPNHQRGHGIPSSSPTPARRIPSFSEFDAIGNDCNGCCLHRYPPTQSLCSRSTPRITSSTPHTQAPSPPTGSSGIPTPRAYASPAHVYVQTPSSARDHQGEVYPTAIISTTLTTTAKASESLKRSFESSSSNCSSLQRRQQRDSAPQASDTSKEDRARRNIRKLLKMQKKVTEVLLDVLDDWPVSKGPPGKRRRRE